MNYESMAIAYLLHNHDDIHSELTNLHNEITDLLNEISSTYWIFLQIFVSDCTCRQVHISHPKTAILNGIKCKKIIGVTNGPPKNLKWI